MPNSDLDREIRNIYQERNTKLVLSQPKRTAGGWGGYLLWLVIVMLMSVITTALFVTWYLPSFFYQPIERISRITTVDTIDVAGVLEKISPATVIIFAERNILPNTLPWQQTYLVSDALGQGVVLSSDGWIVTTSKVIASAKGGYMVATNDGMLRLATMIAVDPATDLVYLKVAAANLSAATFARASDINIGEQVVAVAIGSQSTKRAVIPRFLAGLNSSGIVNNNGDLVKTSEYVQDVLVLDNQLPGNWQGAVVAKADGKVVGLAIGDEAVTYIYPLSTIDKIVSDLFTANKVSRPVLGVNYMSLSAAVPFIENKGDWPSAGVLLTKHSTARPAVKVGSPAAKVGLKENDVITSIAGERVNGLFSFSYLLNQYSPGTKINLVVWRQGKETQVEVTLGEEVNEAVAKGL